MFYFCRKENTKQSTPDSCQINLISFLRSSSIKAAMFAERDGCTVDIVLACFFHDIGHLLAFDQELEQMNGFGVMHHEDLGAQLLIDCGVPGTTETIMIKLVRNIIAPIPALVRNHIKAKRYNIYKNKHYYSQISEASRQTFQFQGGPMTQQEACQFERDTLFEKSLQVRKYDELGKEPGTSIKVRALNVIINNLIHTMLLLRNLSITKRCYLPT